jgi:tRNA nucleotidyltransferase (CCA-adding enzyme)
MKPPNTETIIYRLKSGLPDELHRPARTGRQALPEAGRKSLYCRRHGKGLAALFARQGYRPGLEGDSHSLAIELARIFDVEITLHEQFRTAKLSVGGFSIDVATARKEAYSHPGALPTVQAGTIEDDLRRRDFL